jgi:hypothetical protein
MKTAERKGNKEKMKLKKFAGLGLIFGFIFSFSMICGCGGGGDSSGSSTTTTPTTSTPTTTPSGQNVSDKGIVMGKITDENGAAVSSVSVTLDSTTIASNEQGFFVIEQVTAGTDKVLRYSKAGYVPGTKTVNVVAGQESFANLSLKAVGISQQLTGSAGGTVTDDRTDGQNGSIIIPANAVVNAAGAPVSSYTVELTTLLPSDPNYSSLFPGKFLGGSTPGSTANPQPLISYGVVNVDLKDSQGNKVFLASGAKATINFPIDPAHDPGTSTVPIWYLDENTGVWIQEGTAAKSGSFYTADVSHLTPWNVDIMMPDRSTKVVEVVGLDGALVQNAFVIVEGTGYRQTGYTGSAGTVSLVTRGNDTIRVWAEKGTLKSAVTTETAASSGNSKTNRIELIEPLVTVTMSWGVNPSDLDSHMTGPLTGTSRFHVWYSDQGSLSLSPYCSLDTDDTTSYGPEIVTVTKLVAGVYRYSVHNYSTQSSFKMESSGCVVNVVIPKSGIIRRYDIPASNPANGNLWVVFELTVDSTGNIALADVNQFKETNPSGQAVD